MHKDRGAIQKYELDLLESDKIQRNKRRIISLRLNEYIVHSSRQLEYQRQLKRVLQAHVNKFITHFKEEALVTESNLKMFLEASVEKATKEEKNKSVSCSTYLANN